MNVRIKYFVLFSFFTNASISSKGTGGREVRFRSSRHLRILLFIAGEPQKLNGKTYISLESSFHKLFKNLESVGCRTA